MVFAIFHSYSLAIPPSSFTFNMNAINNKAILYHIFQQMCRAATGGVAVIAIMREFPVQHLAFPAIRTPRRWSFQLCHIGAARCRTSLCWTPLSASLSSSAPKERRDVSSLPSELYRRDARDVVDAGLAQRERQPLQLPFLLARRALVLRERIERSPCVWLSLFACRPDQHPADAVIR